MQTTRTTALLLALAAAAAPAAARAGAAGLKHEKSIYADDKEGPLRRPEGVACTDDGRFVVADTGNGRLLTFTWKDGQVGGGAPLKLAQVPSPAQVQLDGAGNVLVLDRKLKRIARLDAAGGFASYVEVKGAAGEVAPASFRVDAAGNLYLLDAASRRILVADPAGRLLREVPLPARQPSAFTDVALGPAGRIYVLDAVSAALWSADPGAAAFQPASPRLKDRMNFPVYLAGDGRGRLFAVDQHGHGIVVLGPDGSFQGRELSMGRAEGLLYYPAQLCVTARGDAFLADRGNDRVQVFSMAR